MNRRATASVVNGRERGEEERICEGLDGTGGRLLADEERGVGVPSGRRSLPIGF
jgi:hypothetical protein